MKHKYFFSMIIAFLIFNSPSYGLYKSIGEDSRFYLSELDNPIFTIQNDTTSKTKSESDRRKFYLTFNTGLPEVIGLGFGYQYADEWSFIPKVSVDRRVSLFTGGLSLRLVRFFSVNLPFNNINVQPTVVLLTRRGRSFHFGLNGFSFEIGIGNESIRKSELDFFWSLGGIISTVKKDKPLYSPSLKLGLNWNF